MDLQFSPVLKRFLQIWPITLTFPAFPCFLTNHGNSAEFWSILLGPFWFNFLFHDLSWKPTLQHLACVTLNSTVAVFLCIFFLQQTFLLIPHTQFMLTWMTKMECFLWNLLRSQSLICMEGSIRKLFHFKHYMYSSPFFFGNVVCRNINFFCKIMLWQNKA